MKHNAQLADQRWAAKARYIEAPAKQSTENRGSSTGNMAGAKEIREGQETIKGGDAPKTEPDYKQGVRSAVDTPKPDAKDDPWKNAAGTPAKGYQPEAWTPGAARRR